MLRPLKIYVDAVQADAREKAESGEKFSSADFPIAPLFAPWLVGVPALTLLSANGLVWKITFLGTLMLSIAGRLWFAQYYQKLVHIYRDQPDGED